ncbi:MAG: GNAT family N-acetyltransferase [Methanohalobium sp.]|uniref:GNAT family N-acetyltransferase n=1 Tax=Methanohalobium sp. TaxID=2837493 RepID=UPI00397B9A39
MNPNITIRRATNKDLLSVYLLLSNCLLEMYDLPAENFIVAEIAYKNKIVGTAVEINRNYPEIHTVAVHPSYRSKGIGSKLVNYLLERQPDWREYIYVQTVTPEFFGKLGFLKLDDVYHKGYVSMFYSLK